MAQDTNQAGSTGSAASPGSAGSSANMNTSGSSAGNTPLFALKHPGILNSQTELDFIKDKIQNGEQPWKEAFDALKNSSHASLSYQEKPFSSVQCGSFNMPNVGCNEMVDDGIAAYSHALIWIFTDSTAHAEKAMAILKAWSELYQENTDSNARLVVAWAAPWYANAAELLRHSSANWPAQEQLQFVQMLDKFLPYVQDNERPENNWIQSRIEAHLAIAVFKDDEVELQAAVERWKFWLPIYLYQSSDGSTPISPPGRTASQTTNLWKSSASGTSFVNGLAMETCRDLGHLGLGFNSMIYAAETAWQQGIDLFSPNKKRLSDFMELHGSWMTGSVAVPNSICGGVVKANLSDPSGIQTPQGGGEQVWEIAWSHLVERLGGSLPYTEQMMNAGRPANASRWVAKWSTLTHGEREF